MEGHARAKNVKVFIKYTENVGLLEEYRKTIKEFLSRFIVWKICFTLIIGKILFMTITENANQTCS
jgi:hypothetical protein